MFMLGMLQFHIMTLIVLFYPFLQIVAVVTARETAANAVVRAVVVLAGVPVEGTHIYTYSYIAKSALHLMVVNQYYKQKTYFKPKAINKVCMDTSSSLQLQGILLLEGKLQS